MKNAYKNIGKPKSFKNAIKIINEAINDPNTIKPIYLLGMLIHNHYVCNCHICVFLYPLVLFQL